MMIIDGAKALQVLDQLDVESPEHAMLLRALVGSKIITPGLAKKLGPQPLPSHKVCRPLP